MQAKPSVALIILTLNAEKDISPLFAGIMQQTLMPDTILVMDSESTDHTLAMLKNFPVTVHTVPRKEFNHGGTRQLATTLVAADIYIFMTQDAFPANPNTFKYLIDALLSEDNIACAYGRQVPKDDADVLSIHGRLCNYPPQSVVRTLADKQQYGIKTCFNSNNLAAYKKTVLNVVGGFPKHIITGEDAYVAAKMLLKGYAVKYAADAIIYHSHNLTFTQEFHRYFSVGVFHGRENWILKSFSSANSEGLKFVKSEIKFLTIRQERRLIPKALYSTFVKYLAYKLGLYEKYIPYFLKKKWGVNKTFWLTENLHE